MGIVVVYQSMGGGSLFLVFIHVMLIPLGIILGLGDIRLLLRLTQILDGCIIHSFISYHYPEA